MSNNKKSRTDGTIPMKGKNVPSSITSSNTTDSFNDYTKREDIAVSSKTNQNR